MLCRSAEGKPEAVVSGVVTPSTRVTYRSRSSHMVLLIQMSREMWQFDNDGEMHFEKVRGREVRGDGGGGC